MILLNGHGNQSFFTIFLPRFVDDDVRSMVGLLLDSVFLRRLVILGKIESHFGILQLDQIQIICFVFLHFLPAAKPSRSIRAYFLLLSFKVMDALNLSMKLWMRLICQWSYGCYLNLLSMKFQRLSQSSSVNEIPIGRISQSTSVNEFPDRK